jgi:proteasome activator subunit 4
MNQIQWHVPNDEEISFAIELMDDIAAVAMERIEKLLEDNVSRDAIWRNDFCRNFAFLQEAFSSIGALAKAEATPEETEAYYATTDLPYVIFLDTNNVFLSSFRKSIPEMIAKWGAVETGYPLRDRQDPRYMKIIQHRRRFADILLRSSRVLRHQGEENTVDAIHAVVRGLD